MNDEKQSKPWQSQLIVVAFWLILLALARSAIQSMMYIADNKGNQLFSVLNVFELNHYQSTGISLFFLALGIAAYLFYKSRRAVKD